MSQRIESLNKYTAIYRCPDDVIHLQIRVKIREIENSIANESSHQWDSKIFSWQTKSFSKFEREFYSDENNCYTALEKKYNEILEESPPSDTLIDLYCYTEEDDFNPENETLSPHLLFSSTKEVEEEDDEGIYNMKKSIIAAARNPISHNLGYDVMHIMADLGESVETTWIRNEIVLCTIKYDEKLKILSVFPDFTRTQPYEISTASRHFEYFLESESTILSEDDQTREKELCKKITNHKITTIRHITGTDFTLPPRTHLQTHLFLEISWGRNFQNSPISVQYYIDLPQDWSSDHPLGGITQTSTIKSEAHFGHNLEITLTYNLDALHNTKIPKSPYIYFEVISRDSFDRYRTEGLCYTHIPLKPGNYRMNLQCFRLIPPTISGRLRRFFIGDCNCVSDVTWIGIPLDSDNGSVINKYGTCTEGTGEIGLRMGVLQQSQAFCHHGDQKNSEIFDRLNASTLVKSVEQVLMAFRQARNKMMQAKKKL